MDSSRTAKTTPQAIDALDFIECDLARSRGLAHGRVSERTALAKRQDARRQHLLSHGDGDQVRPAAYQF